MRYMLNLIRDEADFGDVTPEEMQADLARWNAFNSELVEAGAYLAGDPLEGSEAATTLHVHSPEERITTDGPFAETKEQLGGFYLLECADLDEAIGWARKVPVSGGAIEIRPVRDLTPFGYEVPRPRVGAGS